MRGVAPQEGGTSGFSARASTIEAWPAYLVGSATTPP